MTMNTQLMRSLKNEDALYHIRVSGGSLLKIRIANLITGTRILCSVVLLFCPAFSPPFYVLYFVAGLTDMIDGPVARKTGTVNKLGAKLDTAADFVFVAVCLWKLLPSLAVPLWLWIWIVLIALIKMINIISGYHGSGKSYVQRTGGGHCHGTETGACEAGRKAIRRERKD